MQNAKTVLQKLLALASTEHPDLTHYEAILANEVVKAERGDGWSIDRILSRLKGNPFQAMRVQGGNEDKPVGVTFTLIDIS